MWNDVQVVIWWWFVWWLLGVVSLPLTTRWMVNLWDSGYSFAKVLGWVAVGYVVWLGASAGVWEFGSLAIWAILIIWVGVNIWIVISQKSKIRSLIQENWRLWIKLELVFLMATLVWAMVRGYQPDINGLEKFMDFGFVQSILQSRTFPPHDMWFAGGHINYYYFGHYLSAVMVLLSGVKPSISYNLMIATLFGLSVSLSIAVGGSISKYQMSNFKYQIFGSKLIIIVGLLTAFLLAMRGNLHTTGYNINKWLGERGWHERIQSGPVNVNDKKDFICQTGVNWLPCPDSGYWYPDATRYIPFTIHEFPIYSFVVADLHAHLINLPLVLLFIAGLVVIVRRNQEISENSKFQISNDKQILKLKGIDSGQDPGQVRATVRMTKELETKNQKLKTVVNLWEVGIFGWLLGVFAMTNAWDVPIYGLVLGITLGVVGLSQVDWDSIKQNNQLAILAWSLGKTGVALVGLALAVSLPFQLNFEQIAEGVKLVDATSAIYQLGILWGWDVFLFVSLFAFVITDIKNQISSKNVKGQMPNASVWDWVILGWYCVGWLLVILPEFIYVKDIYIADYHRANTMFKLVYQAWVLFAVCGAYTIVRLATAMLSPISQVQSSKFKVQTYGRNFVYLGWLVLVVLGLVGVGSYPKFAMQGFYGEMKIYRGLDGEEWLVKKYPDDYSGIVWLREETEKQKNGKTEKPSVVLEAVGDSYTEFDRVSAYTGLPTVEGWLVHEWLWRGAYDMPGARRIAVEHIYNAIKWDDAVEILNLEIIGERKNYTAEDLLKLYGVDYIFVGSMEREKYPNLIEEKFGETGEIVFESGETRIYKIFN